LAQSGKILAQFWKFLDNKTLYRTFDGFWSKFLTKNDKFGYLNPILGKLGMTHDLGGSLESPCLTFYEH